VTRTAVPDVVSRNTVKSAGQWRARGISPPLLRSLVRSGDLIRMRQGVYATKRAVDWAGADPVRAHALKVLAATATAGGNAVASYHSAAQLHRLSLLTSPPAGTVALTLPPARKWNRAKPADVVFHASELQKNHVTRLYNLPLTTAARTVADLARTLPFMDGVVVADSALNQEKATKPELLQALDQCKGWPGVRQARRALEFADERAESPLESAARVVFAEAGLDPPELQVTIQGAEFAALVDFLWRPQKVIAEADGLVKYNDRKDLLAERERDHQLREAGYTVVHFTWQDLFQSKEAKEEVIDRISSALRGGGLAPVDGRP
jgi:very-short-patch-repair endonuclease/predicted transcriptional regulator of viral defense system